MAEIVSLKFIKPDGSECTIRTHSDAASKQREHYEKKGFLFIPADSPSAPVITPAQAEVVAKRGRKPSEK